MDKNKLYCLVNVDWPVWCFSFPGKLFGLMMKLFHTSFGADCL